MKRGSKRVRGRTSDVRQRRNKALRTEGSETTAAMAGVGDDKVTPSGPDETEGGEAGSKLPVTGGTGRRTFKAMAAALLAGLFVGRLSKGR